MMRSSSTMSGFSRKYFSIATIPSSASMTSWEALSRIRLRIRRDIAESSTMRIFAISGLHNTFDDLFQRNDAVRQSRFNDCSGHSVHHTALFGFRKSYAALRFNLLDSFFSIFAHSGHHNSEYVLAERFGRGAKQHVHRRAMQR